MIDLNPEGRRPRQHIDPHPLRHFWGWLFRKRVYAEDAVRYSSYEIQAREVEDWKSSYYELEEYLRGIAREHHPTVWEADKFTHQIGASMLELKCAKCAFMWPCPSWSLATRNDLEPLRIVLEQRKKKTDG